MGKWHKVESKPWSPCDGCQVGWGSISYEIRNGELWAKSDDCHEECQQYKDWCDALLELAKQ